MSLVERFAGFSLLSELDRDEVTALADAAQVRDVQDGAVIVREGDDADGFFVVLDGRVLVTQDVDGRQQTVSEHSPGALLGLVALVDRKPRSATCRAAGRTTIAWFPAAAFHLLHQGSPRLALHFRKIVARQLARDARALNLTLVQAMLDAGKQVQPGLSGEFHIGVSG